MIASNQRHNRIFAAARHTHPARMPAATTFSQEASMRCRTLILALLFTSFALASAAPAFADDGWHRDDWRRDNWRRQEFEARRPPRMAGA